MYPSLKWLGSNVRPFNACSGASDPWVSRIVHWSGLHSIQHPVRKHPFLPASPLQLLKEPELANLWREGAVLALWPWEDPRLRSRIDAPAGVRLLSICWDTSHRRAASVGSIANAETQDCAIDCVSETTYQFVVILKVAPAFAFHQRRCGQKHLRGRTLLQSTSTHWSSPLVSAISSGVMLMWRWMLVQMKPGWHAWTVIPSFAHRLLASTAKTHIRRLRLRVCMPQGDRSSGGWNGCPRTQLDTRGGRRSSRPSPERFLLLRGRRFEEEWSALSFGRCWWRTGPRSGRSICSCESWLCSSFPVSCTVVWFRGLQEMFQYVPWNYE